MSTTMETMEMMKEKTQNYNPEHREGPVARAIEEQTAKLPSDVFLWGAIASMGASFAFKVFGASKMAMFIGQWAPSLLILGLYNKLVKIQGHDKLDK